ncbi:biotin transporter BioY [Jeotgalibaca sp. A127]|uniref:biotin transporter BioY n=1 Tax=Jeotgalibaca sp. A127 TaxID=3457324 RepID=UPI003FD1824D
MTLTTREMTRISIMAALTLVSSFISIPLGPVAITLQTLFVLLTGLLFTPKLAFYTQLLNLILTLLVRGPQIVLGPSFGFLVAFIVVATLIAWLKVNKKIQSDTLLVTVGTIVSYLIGTPYMAFILNGVMELNLSTTEVLYSGIIMFLPGDALKALLAVVVVKSVSKTLATYP